MFYDIVILDPNNYIKKSKKSNDFKEINEFIEVLQRKLNYWNITYLYDNKVGVAHKLKYDQFESTFFTKSHLIVYIVGQSSEEFFRDSVKKLINTCHQISKLGRIVVISLDKNNFEELRESAVNLVYFENCAWRSEGNDQWNELEKNLREKLHNVEDNDTLDLSNTNSLTLPVPIPHQKSSSKFKSFFNSLPSKFDIDMRRHFKDKAPEDNYNESVPNIKISNSNLDDTDVGSVRNDTRLRHKEDHSKLSLNSLFRKRSRKTRDSGLSVGSSNSNDSRKSDTFSRDMSKSADLILGQFNDTSSTCERSVEVQTSTLTKTRTYKAKIHMFKDKASKMFQSANCINSPDNKRRKQIEDVPSNDAPFSSHQIMAFTDILIGDKKPDPKPNINLFRPCIERGHSEPPIGGPIQQNGKLKYYSWNMDLTTSQELILDKLTGKDDEISPTKSQPSYHLPADKLDSNEYSDVFDSLAKDNMVSTDSTADGGMPLREICLKNSNTDSIDEKYFQIQYAPNTASSPSKTTKHSVTFKIDGLDSLENIMESIQKSCDEMKVRSRSNGNNGGSPNTFKGQTGKGSTNKIQPEKNRNNKNEEVKQHVLASYEEAPLRYMVDQAAYVDPQSSGTQMRSESNANSTPSMLQRTPHTIVKTSLIVVTLFTAVAITAPVWINYVPHGAEISQFVCTTGNRILTNGMVTSIPSQLVSTTAMATDSLKRALGRIPSNNPFHKKISLIL